jgi:hypothetical protein
VRWTRSFLSSCLLCLIGTVVPQIAQAQTVVTKTYVLVITEHCEGGFLGCKNVDYVVVNRLTGASSRLKGIATVRNCLGTADPCEWTGWRFKSGAILYVVTSGLRLEVWRRGKLIVEEQGSYADD